MSKLVERFINYVKFDTQSDENSTTCPSTEKQLKLAVFLKDEMIGMGLEDVTLDENGYLMATLPSNTDRDVPTFGFVAHMDTAPAFSGKDIKPKFVDYKGGDIVLNEEKNIVLSPKDFKELDSYIGETLITTDGTTLLGADDKAGIAEILTAMEYLMDHPEIKHGKIRIGFTPDEEIGAGADLFDVEKFGAEFAYTIDGGRLGEVEYENFNAASAKIKIRGRSVHPGTAKDQLVNALQIGIELHNLLPVNQRPEFTVGYEGFYMLSEMSGDISNAKLDYIIRDHHMEKFIEKKEFIGQAVELLNKKYNNAIELELKDSYYNMKEKIEEKMEVFDIARDSMIELGIEPVIKPVRGGTDGARLSYMGLPCPNIFTGGHNFHGQYEYIPVSSMERAVEVIVKISENIGKR
ncbi:MULTISPECIES: peptidase T [Psychrilyobacter]|uniref:Peptidase T n=1 Tax=Psychrilyobacter piezotolerans TaxID=2293438 RepID=A0ABX9KF94_9FUSO|nr:MULTISPECIES: peptidase T [Psychrilyobacter]MCS5421597.1 peptidase T [Psychrilyobacter sp. S5]NDI78169.1 peptidase T [Psychrilyobacter piezotolerans]RDE60139.1 peptidase T [Psychrilyobacter sp. S5]REI40321.1 peptidase T [Psychrilyobacter piezotolerans]